MPGAGYQAGRDLPAQGLLESSQVCGGTGWELWLRSTLQPDALPPESTAFCTELLFKSKMLPAFDREILSHMSAFKEWRRLAKAAVCILHWAGEIHNRGNYRKRERMLTDLGSHDWQLPARARNRWNRWKNKLSSGKPSSLNSANPQKWSVYIFS